MKYEKRLRKEGNMPRLTYQAKSLPLQREFGRVALETINNMWFLGKRESVNALKKAAFDGFREKDE
jgi:hypothetical protein